ncbi:metallophosphoesterase [Schleiferilactobacillus perolens]|jgi:putative phosphoesterase|uniref:metallophosphoesterase n=1 Tax=Schleiferilactobacillus perolens TaxID=100468 RepID=UPI00235741AD|nr:metallophosphoesterase [Schleiferilactobacillus perolens]MCI2172109.1 metallophosphoesterase [Schleiferilactobacillus perolens]
MRVAFSTDVHYDVNHLDARTYFSQQKEYLVQHDIGVYVIGGDIFNNFQETVRYVHDFQAYLGDEVRLYFIAGNHDMVKNVTYSELETLQDPAYLHHRVVSLPGTDYTLVGNNGWYDYSLAPAEVDKTAEDFNRWKKAFWIDSAIDSPLSDADRMARVLDQVQMDLHTVAAQGKKALFVTHFVPRRDFLIYAADRPYWNMATALMGSSHLGDLLAAAPVVDTVVFGHLHHRDAPLMIGDQLYLHTPLGYGLKRAWEWQTSDFMTEWRHTLMIRDLSEKSAS